MNNTQHILKSTQGSVVSYQKTVIDGIDIFYREAGSKQKPTLLLLHGFPSSSHMFRNIIPELSKSYHVIAPDFPGFGHSAMPDRASFTYSFDNIASLIGKLLMQLSITHYALYVFDYGAPIGFRLFQNHPERITSIITQNGNAYEEGMTGFWDPIKAYWATRADKERDVLRALLDPSFTRWQYETGVPEEFKPSLSPDGWQYDQSLLDRTGNANIQLDLFYDYRNNVSLYPTWQKLLREHNPPVLVVWGKNDQLFVEPGGWAFKRDVPDAEIHMLDTGHFALETHGSEISHLIVDFLNRKIKRQP